MVATLLVETGPTAGQELPLRAKKTLVGRGRDCDIQILNESLSRVHCLIEKKGERCVLTDLNSRNGTMVDGKPAENAELVSGSVVTMGDVRLKFVEKSAVFSGDTHRDLLSDAQQGAEKIQKRIDPAKASLIGESKKFDTSRITKRLHRDLAAICKVGHLINSEHELNRLCKLIVDSVREVLHAERVLLMVRENDNGSVAVQIMSADEDIDPDIAVSSTILNEALSGGMAVLSSNTMDDERFREGESIVMHNITSAICVPVFAENSIAGAIYADRIGVSDGFVEEDLEVLSAIGEQSGVAIERARLMKNLEDLFYEMVSTLVATIEANDTYTRGHSERVTELSVGIAQAIGKDENFVKNVRLAGLLHDVGKIGIPANILNKEESLTHEEWEIIKGHPDLGAKIVGNIRRIRDTVGIAIRHHHERWDGAGYPEGLVGEEIPLMSRILSVADAFDAMTSTRPYRKNMLTSDEALEELRRNASVQFDPSIVETFKNAFSDIVAGCSERKDAAPGQQDGSNPLKTGVGS